MFVACFTADMFLLLMEHFNFDNGFLLLSVEVSLLYIPQKMCAIEEELESKLGIFRFQLNGKSNHL